MRSDDEFYRLLVTAGAAFVATLLKFLRPDAKHNARTVAYMIVTGVAFCAYVGPWAKEFYGLNDAGMNAIVLCGTYFSEKVLSHIDELISLYATKMKGGGK